jgi:D-aminoacyl-tRNA deacylase
MKIVVQRALNSFVTVDQEIVGEIDSGLVLFVCFEKKDEKSVLQKACDKVLNLRIFENEETGRMDKSIVDCQGQVLSISQFTLSWDGRKGNRPSFDNSMPPQDAQILFRLFNDLMRSRVSVQTGRFGEKMAVSIVNDGPVTFHLHF